MACTLILLLSPPLASCTNYAILMISRGHTNTHLQEEEEEEEVEEKVGSILIASVSESVVEERAHKGGAEINRP